MLVGQMSRLYPTNDIDIEDDFASTLEWLRLRCASFIKLLHSKLANASR